ncbi:MAG: hypothetical protein KME27_10890 [Lyngbya sp. HA4199-MV5]|nr:hypothetical protein [Lyngbya sp. HA4199-MV5]
MGAYNFSEAGMQRLGRLIRDLMEAAPVTMEQLVEELATVGYDTNMPKLQRFRKGVGLEPPIGLVWALARLKRFCRADGQAYTLEDYLLVATEGGDTQPEPSPKIQLLPEHLQQARSAIVAQAERDGLTLEQLAAKIFPQQKADQRAFLATLLQGQPYWLDGNFLGKLAAIVELDGKPFNVYGWAALFGLDAASEFYVSVLKGHGNGHASVDHQANAHP